MRIPGETIGKPLAGARAGAADNGRSRITPADSTAHLPAVVLGSGTNAWYAYEEFFTGLDSSHTARAYRHGVNRFLAWCDESGTPLTRVTPRMIFPGPQGPAGGNQGAV